MAATESSPEAVLQKEILLDRDGRIKFLREQGNLVPLAAWPTARFESQFVGLCRRFSNLVRTDLVVRLRQSLAVRAGDGL